MKDRRFDVVVVTVCAAVLVAVLLGALIAGKLRERRDSEIRAASHPTELEDAGCCEVPVRVDFFAGVDRSGQHAVCELCGKVLDGSEGWHECAGENLLKKGEG